MTEVKVEQGKQGVRITGLEESIQETWKAVNSVRGTIVKGLAAVVVVVVGSVIVNGVLLKFFNGG